MISLKQLSPGGPRFQEIEFFLLLAWALLFPAKIGYAYYLGFVFLLAVFALTKLQVLRNVARNRFSVFLLLLNLLLVFSAFFSRHPYKSLLFAADVFLVSFWAVFFFLEKRDMERYLRLVAGVISISSLAMVSAFALQGGRGIAAPCFENPILQSIASAMAVLVFLHALLRRYSHADLALLGLNGAAVIIGASKAAFLGLFLFAAVMILQRRRRWALYPGVLLLILIVFPNPVRRSLVHSLRQDPYVFDRLDIWRMSARMFRAHPWTGVGPDLFAEAAPRFNFAQNKGPSRYGKIPESPHSDYWKIIAENGLPGLIFVLLTLFLAIRRLLSPPWSDLSKWLLAFLLVQMLLINCIFNFFFLMLFFLLLQDFLYSRPGFVSLRPGGRLFLSALLVFFVAVLYLLPYMAERRLDAASAEKDLPRRLSLLGKAAALSPLDERPFLFKGENLRFIAAKTGNLDAWNDAWESVRRAQRLNRNSSEALFLEAELFRGFQVKGGSYPALADEVLGPLRRAEALEPFNPFLRLRQALVLRDSGRKAEARKQAQAALDLEADYAAAILFLHELDGLPADDTALWGRIAHIRGKADRLHAPPGSYVFKLHQLPDRSSGK